MTKLIQHSYGKSRVRLMKVTRHADRHDLKELSVDILLHGDFAASHTRGDNRQVIATDSMKNTVYALARQHILTEIEPFGITLAGHFVHEYPQVSAALVNISEQPWERIASDGKPHPHAFSSAGGERRICQVNVMRQVDGPPTVIVESGIENLEILKTTDSTFAGFVRDRYTTLKDTQDRILATVLSARWTCRSATVDWNACHKQVRRTLLEVFAKHHSLAVQQTLYAMGEAALAACDSIGRITLEMPNRHRLLVNLEPFGLDNPNEIFVPTDEPFGLITATLARE